ncbi:MAG TPA: DUF4445 domain-containing protein [Chloroflexi bacterium]|nr:MAG: ferredoxin [Chloroflexota bacterium]HDD56117.1 DUF4445 domain-containing protein [Chloroflexota bacterium]
MATICSVKFDIAEESVEVPAGTLLTTAAEKAGIEINQPCGGQGRCGQCAVQVTAGKVRRRSTMRLSQEIVEQGFALACQTIVEGDLTVIVPPQEMIQQHLTTGQSATDVSVPEGYDPHRDQTLSRVPMRLKPPSMEDQTSDWDRVQTTILGETGLGEVEISLEVLQKLPVVLREGKWQATAVLYAPDGFQTDGRAEVIDMLPGLMADDAPLWGAAVDIGTTTVKVMLVDLMSGEPKGQASEYNAQIARGEDVISRIIFASKGTGDQTLRELVLKTINELLRLASKRGKTRPEKIYHTVISGNSTMIHLLLQVPPSSIRLAPYITVANHIPVLRAREAGLNTCPTGKVTCLPGVASYVGSDITAGVLSSGMSETDKVTLFLDVGTNGEMVLGSREWLVTCACSAGPAFEGAGVLHGMRATTGAIDEVWINTDTWEASWRVIGGGKPKGLCGSALISLLAEMLMTGVINKSGRFDFTKDTNRIRKGSHGGEYVVSWAEETEIGEDIILTEVDIDNLMRAKAAIFAGFTVLGDSVGIPLESVEQVLIGGGFGQYINVEKAVQIGLLPDMPWERFQFLGNTSLKGAYLALLDHKNKAEISEIASKMTYIELSADNRFFDAFTSAMFLPHTDLSLFPSVEIKVDK